MNKRGITLTFPTIIKWTIGIVAVFSVLIIFLAPGQVLQVLKDAFSSFGLTSLPSESVEAFEGVIEVPTALEDEFEDLVNAINNAGSDSGCLVDIGELPAVSGDWFITLEENEAKIFRTGGFGELIQKGSEDLNNFKPCVIKDTLAQEFYDCYLREDKNCPALLAAIPPQEDIRLDQNSKYKYLFKKKVVVGDETYNYFCTFLFYDDVEGGGRGGPTPQVCESPESTDNGLAIDSDCKNRWPNFDINLPKCNTEPSALVTKIDPQHEQTELWEFTLTDNKNYNGGEFNFDLDDFDYNNDGSPECTIFAIEEEGSSNDDNADVWYVKPGSIIEKRDVGRLWDGLIEPIHDCIPTSRNFGGNFRLTNQYLDRAITEGEDEARSGSVSATCNEFTDCVDIEGDCVEEAQATAPWGCVEGKWDKCDTDDNCDSIITSDLHIFYCDCDSDNDGDCDALDSGTPRWTSTKPSTCPEHVGPPTLETCTSGDFCATRCNNKFKAAPNPDFSYLPIDGGKARKPIGLEWYTTREASQDPCNNNRKCELLEGNYGDKVWKPKYEILCDDSSKWKLCNSAWEGRIASATVDSAPYTYTCNGGKWVDGYPKIPISTRILHVKIDPRDNPVEKWAFYLTDDKMLPIGDIDDIEDGDLMYRKFDEELDSEAGINLCRVYAVNEEEGEDDHLATWYIEPGGRILTSSSTPPTGNRLFDGIDGKIYSVLQNFGEEGASPYPDDSDEAVGENVYSIDNDNDRCGAGNHPCNLVLLDDGSHAFLPKYELLCDNEGFWRVCEEYIEGAQIIADSITHTCQESGNSISGETSGYWVWR